MTLQRSRIEWVLNFDGTQGYSWTPCPGCSNRFSCREICWAMKYLKRFSHSCMLCATGTPHLHRFRLSEPTLLKKPSTIATNLLGDLWCDGMKDEWIRTVLDVVERNQRHVFLSLTKNPKRMLDFKDQLIYCPNMWLGATIMDATMIDSVKILMDVNLGHVLYGSFEPLRSKIPRHAIFGLEWIIIGAQTKPNVQPEQEWVESLVTDADALGIPVFMKDNLEWHEKKRRAHPDFITTAGRLLLSQTREGEKL